MIDFKPIFGLFLNFFWWVIPLVVLSLFMQTLWFKGLVGEWVVKLYAKLFLTSDRYTRFHNITLPTPDGTTQIDHVFVSRFGVFVVETKNMKGWIFGSERQKEWTQKIYKQSFKFQNPLRQNYKHEKALEAALAIPSGSIHSVIVFVGGATFKTDMPPCVTYHNNFANYIRSFSTPVFSKTQVKEICDRLSSSRLKPSFKLHRSHVRNLKTRSDPNAERYCPKCGKRMVVRTATRGASAGKRFWGCSGFPGCKIVQTLTFE